MHIFIKNTFSNTNQMIAKTFSVILAVAPLCLLSVKGWIDIILALSFIAALLILNKQKTANPTANLNSQNRRWLKILGFVFASYFIAVLLGQIFRQNFSWSNYDSPAHLLLCIPIMYAIVSSKQNVAQLVTYILPSALFISLISITLNPHVVNVRVTTQAADLLTFGSLSITFGLLCLISIEFSRNRLWLNIYKLCGFLVGTYLSILTNSRTGWLALPFVLLLWFYTEGPKFKLSTFMLAFMLTGLISLGAYEYIPVVHDRLYALAHEVAIYQWNAVNPDTSTGMRISFLRIAFDVFWQNPWGGWGDTGFAHLLNSPEITRYATETTIDTALHAGFHNEITTNMVRSGVWGIISSISIFVVPFWFFTRQLALDRPEHRKIALLASCFMLCAFFNGMSTEILNLKYTATFYGLMIAIFAGSLVVLSDKKSNRHIP